MSLILKENSTWTGYSKLYEARFTNSDASLRSMVVWTAPGRPKISNLPAIVE